MSEGIGVGPRLTELARYVEVPRSTANLRVRMLMERGIVTGYRPVLKEAGVGFWSMGSHSREIRVVRDV
jgi:DNA-binding Lrp family transcriptional regulator